MNHADAVTALRPFYDRYVEEVSPADHAVSLETAASILCACRRHSCGGRAVDFGSGFTSFVLRTTGMDVVSVDDSPAWLGRTAAFVGTDVGLLLWDAFRAHAWAPFDVVVYDFSHGETRNAHVDYACGLIAPGGVGIFDDMHQAGHRRAVTAAAARHALAVSPLPETQDRFGRYAWALYPGAFIPRSSSPAHT